MQKFPQQIFIFDLNKFQPCSTVLYLVIRIVIKNKSVTPLELQMYA